MEEIKELFDYKEEELLEALSKRDIKKIRYIFEECNLVDIANTFNSLENINEYIFIFKIVNPEYTAILFTYLDSDVQEKIVLKLTSDQLGDILENLYTDDVVDFIQEMPANLSSRIIQACSKEQRNMVNQLLSYKEDSAGSIMTTEYIILRENDSMDDALNKIKKNAQEAESLSYLFVTDSQRILKGTITLRDVLAMKDDEKINDVMTKDIVSVYTYTDQEEVAHKMSDYDISVIPVITNDNRLVGIITGDDIIDIIQEETTEDIHLMANVNPLEDEYSKTNAFTLAKNGVGWIVLLMVLSTFTSVIMNSFEEAMVAISSLSIFVPMLIGTAGNAGNQSSAVIIRALGLGDITTKDYIKIATKELLSALMVGLVVAIFDFGWILFISKVGIIEVDSVYLYKMALLVGCSILLCILFAKFVGSSLPILFQALHLDPALLAGPTTTTLVDACSLIIYFMVAKLIFKF